MKILIYAPDTSGLKPLIDCCQYVLNYFVKDNKDSRVFACIADQENFLDILLPGESFVFIFYDISKESTQKMLRTLYLEYNKNPKRIFYIRSDSKFPKFEDLQATNLPHSEFNGDLFFVKSDDYLKYDRRHTFLGELVREIYSITSEQKIHT